jgi:rare lipoprotein A
MDEDHFPILGVRQSAMLRLFLLLLVIGLSACASLRPEVPIRAPTQPSFTETGVASWYGKAHHGRRTANGERFDMRAMTAAHRTLPFDTIVRVTNLDTGKVVKVRINDRGPYVKGRIIDLSAKAAQTLDISEDGTANVRIETFAADQS